MADPNPKIHPPRNDKYARAVKVLRIEYLGEGSKVVELPVPFRSLKEKTGEVLCDPIGSFPLEDGNRLLEMGSLFRLIETIYEPLGTCPKCGKVFINLKQHLVLSHGWKYRRKAHYKARGEVLKQYTYARYPDGRRLAKHDRDKDSGKFCGALKDADDDEAISEGPEGMTVSGSAEGIEVDNGSR